MTETQRKRPKTQETYRNSGTLPRPKGFLYQRPYRTSGALEQGVLGPCPTPNSDNFRRERGRIQGGYCQQKHPTETQTLKYGEEGNKPSGNPQQTTKPTEKPQKLRDPAPT